MKKILLTTTALTMLAGAAAADISISGTARMGVSHNAAGANAGTTVNNRMRVNFNGSGETDGGLTFGAHLRIQSGGNVTAGAATWISNSLEKPVETPITILLTSDRASPCKAFTSFTSLDRSTTISLSF